MQSLAEPARAELADLQRLTMQLTQQLESLLCGRERVGGATTRAARGDGDGGGCAAVGSDDADSSGENAGPSVVVNEPPGQREGAAGGDLAQQQASLQALLEATSAYATSVTKILGPVRATPPPPEQLSVGGTADSDGAGAAICPALKLSPQKVNLSGRLKVVKGRPIPVPKGAAQVPITSPPNPQAKWETSRTQGSTIEEPRIFRRLTETEGFSQALINKGHMLQAKQQPSALPPPPSHGAPQRHVTPLPPHGTNVTPTNLLPVKPIVSSLKSRRVNAPSESDLLQLGRGARGAWGGMLRVVGRDQVGSWTRSNMEVGSATMSALDDADQTESVVSEALSSNVSAMRRRLLTVQGRVGVPPFHASGVSPMVLSTARETGPEVGVHTLRSPSGKIVSVCTDAQSNLSSCGGGETVYSLFKAQRRSAPQGGNGAPLSEMFVGKPGGRQGATEELYRTVHGPPSHSSFQTSSSCPSFVALRTRPDGREAAVLEEETESRNVARLLNDTFSYSKGGSMWRRRGHWNMSHPQHGNTRPVEVHSLSESESSCNPQSREGPAEAAPAAGSEAAPAVQRSVLNSLKGNVALVGMPALRLDEAGSPRVRFSRPSKRHTPVHRPLEEVRRQLEEQLGIPLIPDLDSADFNVYEYYRHHRQNTFVIVVMNVVLRYHLVVRYGLNVRKMMKFFQEVQSIYMWANPFHNSLRAADNTQAMHQYLLQKNLKENFTDIEIFALIFSVAIAKLGHLGVDNDFLVRTRHPYSSVINFAAPTEGTSLILAFSILQSEACHFFPIKSLLKNPADIELENTDEKPLGQRNVGDYEDFWGTEVGSRLLSSAVIVPRGEHPRVAMSIAATGASTWSVVSNSGACGFDEALRDATLEGDSIGKKGKPLDGDVAETTNEVGSSAYPVEEWDIVTDGTFRGMVEELVISSDERNHRALFEEALTMADDGIVSDAEIPTLMKAVMHVVGMCYIFRPWPIFIETSYCGVAELYRQADALEDLGINIEEFFTPENKPSVEATSIIYMWSTQRKLQEERQVAAAASQCESVESDPEVEAGEGSPRVVVGSDFEGFPEGDGEVGGGSGAASGAVDVALAATGASEADEAAKGIDHCSTALSFGCRNERMSEGEVWAESESRSHVAYAVECGSSPGQLKGRGGSATGVDVCAGSPVSVQGGAALGSTGVANSVRSGWATSNAAGKAKRGVVTERLQSEYGPAGGSTLPASVFDQGLSRCGTTSADCTVTNRRCGTEDGVTVVRSCTAVDGDLRGGGVGKEAFDSYPKVHVASSVAGGAKRSGERLHGLLPGTYASTSEDGLCATACCDKSVTDGATKGRNVMVRGYGWELQLTILRLIASPFVAILAAYVPPEWQEQLLTNIEVLESVDPADFECGAAEVLTREIYMHKWHDHDITLQRRFLRYLLGAFFSESLTSGMCKNIGLEIA